ncbi:MAG: CRISPR system precrRNA processing endoribonuclease RAMP protein Cas6 [Syntrophaceae bacterium]|nr:CRISPR system precrRNA processing endoribonuclease RAMP protein Cas6 [Syntrophaceae bacterium]
MERRPAQFRFAKFLFSIRSESPIKLPPYKGSTFRGAFGHAFKKVVCVSRERICNSCILKEKCVYSYVFETPPPSGTLKMRKYPYAPHPFVINPPLEEKGEYREGEILCFELTLIGKSIDCLPYFIYTFDELGRIGIGKGRGKYLLEEVKEVRPSQRIKGKDDKRGERSEEGKIIYSGKDKILRNHFRVLTFDDLCLFESSPVRIDLLFITPTRLKFDGRLTPKLEFHILMRNLLRRISLLSYFHCGEELELDFKGLIEKSKEIMGTKESLSWFDWERYSNRQEKKMRMGGFIGSITFEGNFEPFFPFLLLGEYINVGKGTSFGLGKYKILNFEF